MQGLICIGGECQTGLLGLRLNLRLGLLAAALGLGLFLGLGGFLGLFLHLGNLNGGFSLRLGLLAITIRTTARSGIA